MRDMTFRERDFLISELDKNDPEYQVKVEELEKECEDWHDENDVIEIGEDGAKYFFEKGAEGPYAINLPVDKEELEEIMMNQEFGGDFFADIY